MIESAIFLTVAVAFLLIIIGFFARVQLLAIAGFVFMLIPAGGILTTGYEVRDGTEIVESTTGSTVEIADSFLLVAGNNDTALSNVQFFNGVEANISETNSAPGLDFRVNFTNVTGFDRLHYRVRTDNQPHITNLELFNYVGDEWQTIDTYTESLTYLLLNDSVASPANFIEGGVVQFRVYHPQTGNINNDHYIDWVALSTDPVTVTTEEVRYQVVEGFQSVFVGLALIVLAVGGLLLVVLAL